MMNIASAKACELFIPFLKKVLAEHGIQVERISLEYADEAITLYDDVHTVFKSPEVITKHFDGVPSMEDYHAGNYSLSTNLTPKEYAIACDNHVEHMMHYHAEDCGATCREELVKWIGNEGMRQFFAVSGNAPNAMTRKQQNDIAGRRNETMAMNRARYGAQKQSNLEPVRSVVRQRKFGEPKCPVVENGKRCNKTIISGGRCPNHGGGQKNNKCPVVENGKRCNKSIVSGGRCPDHGGGGKCPVVENGKRCNKSIISGDRCPNHGGGQKKKCPVVENGKRCNKTIISGGRCPNHGGGQRKKN